MAGIIKNQILKHLSRFAKNLSSNSINVNTLRGEGELFNLELNEKVLTDLLELPNWMLISRASVNKVSLKIQWTKLKTTPIHLSLDEVCVEMETCQNLRSHGTSSDIGSYRAGSKYGFVEKVIDGMTVTINSVYVRFNSPSFTTTFNLSRITLCSKSPAWKLADLRLTRLKDLNQQHILLFRELSWHTLKIECKSSDPQMTPIRLITNQSCCRITVKKKLSDCSVDGCRLVLISEDILWVLTDSQILSAYYLVESLSGLIKKATEQSQKAKAARKLESIPAYYSNPLHSYGTSAPSAMQGDKEKGTGLWNSGYSQLPSHVDQSSMQKFQVFKKFDVVETSYHFYSEKIDLHFCDDPGAGRSSYPDMSKGGTLQLNLLKIKLDYYPYHLALGDRTHWIKYQEGSPYQWTKSSLNCFKSNLLDFFSSTHSSHAPLGKASPHHAKSQSSTPGTTESLGDGQQPTKAFICNQYKRLMSTCFLLTCKDLVVYKVALSKRKHAPQEMINSDKSRVCLPDGTPLISMEFSSYYYPGGFNFPVPPPKIYTHVSPFKLDVDLVSCLWLNAFACNLKEKTMKSVPNPPYIDIHTEILMPRIIMKPILKCDKQKGRPRALQILSSRLIISNVRSSGPTDPGSRSDLFTCLEEAQKGPLFFASGFPSKRGDKQPIPSKFLHHAEGADLLSRPLEAVPPEEGYSPSALWTEPRDIVFFFGDSVWMEYVDRVNEKQPQTEQRVQHHSDQKYQQQINQKQLQLNNVKQQEDHHNHSTPFIEPFPISIWVHIKELSFPPSVVPNGCSNLSSECLTNVRDSAVLNGSLNSVSSAASKADSVKISDEASIHALVYAPNLVNLQLTHLQFLFLMRVLDAVTEFTTFLTEDTSRIQTKEESILVAAILPIVSMSLIFPPGLPSVNLPSSPSACNDHLFHTMSSLRPLKDLIAGAATTTTDDTKSNVSKSSNPSLSPSSGFSPTEEGLEGRLAKSQSDGCLTASASPLPNTLTYPETASISKSGEDLNAGSVCVSGNARPVTTAIGITPPTADSHQQKITSSTSSSISSSVRRGLTSGLSGLTSLKNTIESSVVSKMPASGDDAASDTASIHSDLSNDSDTFVMLHLESEADVCSFVRSEFKANQKLAPEEQEVQDELLVEAATDALEDLLSSTTETSETSTDTKAKHYIGVITFRIGNCQAILESEGHNSFIKFQSLSLSHEEWPRITTEEFQSNFKKGKQNFDLRPCSVRLRMNTEGVIKVSGEEEREEDLPSYLQGRYSCLLPVWRNANLEMDVADLIISLLMSTLTELVDFIEDEIVPLPMAMKIKLENLELELVDDKSKLPKSSQRVYIPRLLVDRDDTSYFTLLPVAPKESATNLSYSSTSSFAPMPSFSDPSLNASHPPLSELHEKCSQKEEELRKEMEKLREQLFSCQRENMNLMKALTILHEDRNVRK